MMEERIKELFATHKTDFYDANGMKTEVLTISRFEKAMEQMEQRCYIEEANNEMLIQELNSQKTYIQKLIDTLKETENQLRDVYNTIEFEGKFPVRSALDNAKEVIEQYENGFNY